MADFICISVVLWGFCADGYDEIKKKRSCRLFLPLYDLLHSYPLSFFRSDVLIYMGTFKTNATTTHSANSSSKVVALRCDGTFSFTPFRCVVDIKRHFAQNLCFTGYRFTCHSLARKS